MACACSVTQSCLTLCDSMDCNPPRSSVHGIFQARMPEWVAITFSRGSSRPRDRTQVSCVSWIGWLFTNEPSGKAICVISSFKIFSPKGVKIFTTTCLLYIFRILYKKYYVWSKALLSLSKMQKLIMLQRTGWEEREVRLCDLRSFCIPLRSVPVWGSQPPLWGSSCVHAHTHTHTQHLLPTT